jgi:lysine-specific demethylase/histidyl-hydroxylase NO66
MFTLDDLLHPITPAQFFADYDDRKPLHIPAGSDSRKREVLTWAAWNDMLNRTVTWTSSSLRLLRNHQAIPDEQYCRLVQTVNGPVMQPSPAKMEVFMSAGASVVANDVQQMHAPLAGIADVLSRAYAANIGANIYCSFKGVQAFGTHYDNHHVLVIHTEGEKVWNLYEKRAENPVDNLPDTAETRLFLEQSRGKVMQKVTMRPGDVLYLPRGWYHDALAEDGGSLHVTFSIAPLYGRILFQLLDYAAMQNPAFREYLPPASSDGGVALGRKVTELGEFLARLAASPAFHDEVAMAQERLSPRLAGFALPERKPVTLYQTTGRAFPTASTGVRGAYEWAMQERRFAIEDMIAQIDFASEADLRAGVDAAVAAGALQKV